MYIGEIASLCAALCWAVGLSLFRGAVREAGARQVNFFKGLVAIPLLLICLLLAGTRPIAGDAQVYLALSGIVGVALGDTLLFYALGHLGAHRAALFGTLGPVLTAVGAWLMLGEALTAQQGAGVLLAASGVAMVVYFRGGQREARRATSLGILLGFLSAFCQAGGVLLNKRGLVDADPLSATSLRLSAGIAALALLAFLRGRLRLDLERLWRPHVLRRMVPAAAIGTFGGLWLMAVGIKHTQSAVASALHSTTPLFTLPIALFVLRERVGPLAIAGSFVAVAGVFVLFL